MPNFDRFQRGIVAKVNNLFADNAIWSPSDGSEMQTGPVLFKDPTHVMELSDVSFTPENVFAEYFDEYFVGLKQAAGRGEDEVLVIDGVEYYVRIVRKKYDGRTFIAVLEPK